MPVGSLLSPVVWGGLLFGILTVCGCTLTCCFLRGRQAVAGRYVEGRRLEGRPLEGGEDWRAEGH